MVELNNSTFPSTKAEPTKAEVVAPPIAQYQDAIQQLLIRYQECYPCTEEVEAQLVFDTVRDHYQLVQVGWKGNQRIYQCSLHLDIKTGKIWVQHNRTEWEVGDDLMALGVPRAAIVLGFHHPSMRPYTEFAVG